MKHIFLIFGLLATTPAAADAAISSVNYARQFVYQYCKNPNMQLPGTESASLASQKYILGMIDFMNENKTTYAASSKTDNVASVGYLRESLGKIQSSDVCCPTGYFNVTDGKCANCGIYVPTGMCPENFTETPINNSALPAAGENCPSGTENYSTLPDGCETAGSNSISMCLPMPQLKRGDSVYSYPQAVANNRSYVAYGTGCKITSNGPVCDDTLLSLECHCGASGTIPADNWEDFGQFCWIRIIGVKTAAYGTVFSDNSGWGILHDYALVADNCTTWCCKSVLDRIGEKKYHILDQEFSVFGG